MRYPKTVLCVLISASILLEPAAARGQATRTRAALPELERLVKQVSVLEAQNAELERRLRHTTSRLEQALAELRGAPTDPRPVVRAGPRGRRRPEIETGNRLLSRARAEVARGRAVVSGILRHGDKETLSGTLVVELYRDGFKVDEVRRPFEVPAYQVVRYRQVFELEGYAAGHYTARAGLLH